MSRGFADNPSLSLVNSSQCWPLIGQFSFHEDFPSHFRFASTSLNSKQERERKDTVGLFLRVDFSAKFIFTDLRCASRLEEVKNLVSFSPNW